MNESNIETGHSVNSSSKTKKTKISCEAHVLDIFPLPTLEDRPQDDACSQSNMSQLIVDSVVDDRGIGEHRQLVFFHNLSLS